jgi:integrase/recombinase XerD
MSSKTALKSFSELVQSFFCQRLQMQQRVSGHTLASYRDTFRLGFEFIRKKTGPFRRTPSATVPPCIWFRPVWTLW